MSATDIPQPGTGRNPDLHRYFVYRHADLKWQMADWRDSAIRKMSDRLQLLLPELLNDAKTAQEVRQIARPVLLRIESEIIAHAAEVGEKACAWHSDTLSVFGGAKDVERVAITREQYIQAIKKNKFAGRTVRQWIHRAFEGAFINGRY